VKKRLLSLLIIFSLVLGFIPFGEIKSYGQESHKVRVRVEGKDRTLYDKEVTVTDEVYCDEYFNSLGNSISNGFITTLFGQTPDSKNNETWMNYYVKDNKIDISKSVSQYKLNDVDEAVIYVAKYSSDWSKQKTLIPQINVEKNDKQVQLTVSGKSLSEINPYSDVDLKISYIGNATTNSDGEYSFDLKGIHKVEIGDYPNLVRKTIYVGEKDVIEKVKNAIDDLKVNYNSKNELESWEASAYYVVSETDEEMQKIKDKYNYEVNDNDGVAKIAYNIIGLLSAGKDPRNCNGKDYVKMLKDSQVLTGENAGKFIKKSGDEAYVSFQAFAVLALDLAQEEYDVNSAMHALKTYQNTDINDVDNYGKFGGQYDGVDSAAMALFALANHRNTEGVEESIQAGLDYIKKEQLPTGGFPGYDGESSESIAMVIKALIALDINPLSEEWTKNENMLDALLKFKEGNKFKSTIDSAYNDYSTKQAFSALADLYNGESMYKNLTHHVHEDYEINTGSDVEEPKYDFELKRNGYSDFKRGSEAQLNVDLTNNTNDDKKVTYIVALYKLNGNNKELYTYTFMTKTINAGATEEFAGGFLIPTSGEFEVKGMLWDNFDNKTPLAKEIKVDVE
jgi:hypothetical protein